jgi:hypothetical protein
MTIREGRWDCSSCETVGIRGRHTTCQGCGKSRPEGVRFYLPAGEPAVTDRAAIQRARAGPDWVCEFCGGSNRATRASCTQCGAEKGASTSQPVRERRW